MRLHRGTRRSTLIQWPERVDNRLDLLLYLANQAGENTSRAQLLAALVATVPLDGGRLISLLRKYRNQDEDGFVLEEAGIPPLPEGRRRPGPRGASLEQGGSPPQ
jgi:hypothetical protein